MEFLKRHLYIVFLIPLCLGFRTFESSSLWTTSNTDASSRKLFVVLPESNPEITFSNNYPSGDPLATSSNLTLSTVMQSIYDDFNNINTSYLTLVSSSDSDFAALGGDRTITISFGGASGGNTGEASLQMRDGKFVGCSIIIEESSLSSVKNFTATMTHELGHCLGLDHPQETVNAVMSYYRYNNTIRLQIDDKMGITYLFPIDSSAAKENPTFGLQCSK